VLGWLGMSNEGMSQQKCWAGWAFKSE